MGRWCAFCLRTLIFFSLPVLQPVTELKVLRAVRVTSVQLFLLLESFLYRVYGEVMNRSFSLKWKQGAVGSAVSGLL